MEVWNCVYYASAAFIKGTKNSWKVTLMKEVLAGDYGIYHSGLKTTKNVSLKYFILHC